MYSHDDPNILWVSPVFEGRGRGTYDAPYTEVSQALGTVKPGNTIVLLAGTYNKSVSIQDSGTITEPIRIVADTGAQGQIICLSTWFLYDVSDIILSGLSFEDVPHQAISVIGNCERNNFSGLHFVNCGLDKKAPCTFYFGGAGSKCNVVENCEFEITSQNGPHSTKAELPVALMISEGDLDDKARLNTNHVIRGNSFTNYGCAVIIGTSNNSPHNYSHIFENNHINQCSGDGIRVKCGDTVIQSNLLQQCRGKGVSIAYGKTDVISDNRIEQCGTGIHIDGYDCTIKNNCIVGSGSHAVAVTSKDEASKNFRGTTVIEQNTCVDSGLLDEKTQCEDILIDTNTNCIIQQNIFSSKGQPYSIHADKEASGKKHNTVHIVNNIMQETADPIKGCERQKLPFKDAPSGNYSTTLKYGAQGWAATGGSTLPDFESTTTEGSSEEDQPDGIKKSPAEDLIEEVDEKELYVRSLFLDAEANNMAEGSEESPSDEPPNEDGMIDFSDWD